MACTAGVPKKLPEGAPNFVHHWSTPSGAPSSPKRRKPPPDGGEGGRRRQAADGVGQRTGSGSGRRTGSEMGFPQSAACRRMIQAGSLTVGRLFDAPDAEGYFTDDGRRWSWQKRDWMLLLVSSTAYRRCCRSGRTGPALATIQALTGCRDADGFFRSAETDLMLTMPTTRQIQAGRCCGFEFRRAAATGRTNELLRRAETEGVPGSRQMNCCFRVCGISGRLRMIGTGWLLKIIFKTARSKI
ncbi:hypothetical protein ACLOJK_007612 [Asimina triloba]